jgi:hypothetical protein
MPRARAGNLRRGTDKNVMTVSQFQNHPDKTDSSNAINSGLQGQFF